MVQRASLLRLAMGRRVERAYLPQPTRQGTLQTRLESAPSIGNTRVKGTVLAWTARQKARNCLISLSGKQKQVNSASPHSLSASSRKAWGSHGRQLRTSDRSPRLGGNARDVDVDIRAIRLHPEPATSVVWGALPSRRCLPHQRAPFLRQHRQPHQNGLHHRQPKPPQGRRDVHRHLRPQR
jgi:hypothetical protein